MDSGPIDASIISSIKSINMPFDKPLPPLNWAFLSNVVFDEHSKVKIEEKLIVMHLLARLSGTSQSAIKLITTYLESIVDIYDVCFCVILYFI